MGHTGVVGYEDTTRIKKGFNIGQIFYHYFLSDRKVQAEGFKDMRLNAMPLEGIIEFNEVFVMPFGFRDTCLRVKYDTISG